MAINDKSKTNLTLYVSVDPKTWVSVRLEWCPPVEHVPSSGAQVTGVFDDIFSICLIPISSSESWRLLVSIFLLSSLVPTLLILRHPLIPVYVDVNLGRREHGFETIFFRP